MKCDETGTEIDLCLNFMTIPQKIKQLEIRVLKGLSRSPQKGFLNTPLIKVSLKKIQNFCDTELNSQGALLWLLRWSFLIRYVEG